MQLISTHLMSTNLSLPLGVAGFYLRPWSVNLVSSLLTSFRRDLILSIAFRAWSNLACFLAVIFARSNNILSGHAA